MDPATLREAVALLDAAVAATERGYALSVREMCALPEVGAILGAPDPIRWACVLELLEIGDPAGDRNWYRGQLLALAARRRLDLGRAELEYLLHALARHDETNPFVHREGLRATSGLIEHAFRRLPADHARRLAPVIERLARDAADAGTASRLRQLIAQPDAVPYELVEDGDDIGHRVRAAIRDSAEDATALRAILNLLASYPPSGRPSQRWQREAERVCSLRSRPERLVGALLQAALEASDTVEQRGYSGGSYAVTRWATDGNEAFLCGTVYLAGLTGDAALLPRLGRLAAKSVTVIGEPFGSPRSLRLANSCALAIAAVGAPSSITELLALERTVQHGGVLREVRKAIEALAEAQGMTRDELRERAERPTPPGGGRRAL